MAAKQANTTTLQIAVNLTPSALNFLKQNAKDSDYAGTLAQWSGYWVDQQARGGLMVEPDQHDYLASIAPDGKRFRDSKALIRAVEKGLRRESGQYSFTINVDPSEYPVIKEQAEQSGLTVEESLEGIVKYIISSGMIFDFSPKNGRNIPFTSSMIDAVKELCGKYTFDSTDVSGLIAENRFLPINRETAQKAKMLTSKSEFSPQDIDDLLTELQNWRAGKSSTAVAA